ncbi:MAG: oxygen-dependent FAD-containing oxidoreductase [Parcubacteria bacterium C7867-001]|nr:MAG: oxygen-dependent FAD-containing oxidoreductase [Parcubacteria bacterium C7867-001]
MSTKAIIFDLDGTLSESKSAVTPAMGAVLAKLLTTHPVAVMSGGAWHQFERQLLPAFPKNANFKNLSLFPVSAGYCYQFTNGGWSLIYDNSFSDAERREVLRALDDAMAKTGFSNPPERTWGERIEDRGAEVTFSALGQEAPPAEKKAWDPDRKKRQPLFDELVKRLPHYFIRMNAATSIDITKEGISKAYGIRKFSQMISTPVSEMLYVGDALFAGGNDEVVKETGIKTRQVSGPLETASAIDEILGSEGSETSLMETLRESFKGDLSVDAVERKKYSRDTSLFTRTPSLVAYPKDADDVSTLVRVVGEAKQHGEQVSVTARAAGTDMSGGPLTNSVVAVFTKYMNRIGPVSEKEATTEPGAYYRDFEKETLKHHAILPSYPASRSIAGMGGIVNNDSGGERTLEYGKTRRYIEAVDVVLSDGSQATFKELGPDELLEKKKQDNLEGEIYRRMTKLLIENRGVIQTAEPHISKNSAGYALWDVMDFQNGTMNLAKLICGAQGTLALTTSMTLSLVKPKEHRAMLIVFLSDIAHLPEIVHRVIKHNPESFESYDDHTFNLAIRFLPQMLSQMGLARAVRLGLSFLPEVSLVLRGGVPKLVLMAEFSDDSADAAFRRAKDAQMELEDMKLPTRIAKNEQAAEKYWIVRRESFALLRKNLSGLYASPFIDDFVVPIDTYPKFLPELYELLGKYDLIETTAGHIGNGNFHIIPLMDVTKPEQRKIILELAPKVYDLVLKYGGTTTGEHNDGIIRTPYLEQQYGPKMMELFRETKTIFDPLSIFNPGKKIGGTFADIERDMITSMK